jgi:hypothetical protein
MDWTDCNAWTVRDSEEFRAAIPAWAAAPGVGPVGVPAGRPGVRTVFI